MAKCNICGEEIIRFGNNPWPVRLEGECCDECNYKFVVPARIASTNRGITNVQELADMLNTKTKHQLEILFDVD